MLAHMHTCTQGEHHQIMLQFVSMYSMILVLMLGEHCMCILRIYNAVNSVIYAVILFMQIMRVVVRAHK